MMESLRGGWLSTAIGSMPQTNASDAWASVLLHCPQLPFWPQLPRRSHLEDEYVQFSEAFPGIVMDSGAKRLFVDRTQDLERGLERLYVAYLEDDSTYGSIGADYAAGLDYVKTEGLFRVPPVAIKGQITGPISWGLTVADQTGRPLLYDEILADAVAKHLRLKASWQERQLQEKGVPTVVFIDEPRIGFLISDTVPLDRAQIVALLHEVLAGVSGMKGIHCCSNTDWSLILETPIDIVGLDAYGYAASLALYAESVAAFLDRGGTIAWGIVPADERATMETVDTLISRLEQAMEVLIERGISRDSLVAAGWITPTCGIGSLPVSLADQILHLAAQVASEMRARYTPTT